MAAGGTPGNVQLGPGRLYVAPIGTTEPASASAVLDAAFVAVGYTEAGSQFQTTVTNSEVEVAEEVDPIAYVMSKRASQLAFAMAETTRRRLALALGSGVVPDNATAYEPPDPGSEVAVVIVWDSDEAQTGSTNSRWIFREAKAGGTVTLSRSKAPGKATIAALFNLQKPSGLAPFKVFPDSAGRV